ncbi:hypothetical protein NSK_006840 [Nannochloropsis salina CCMP1776]|uniref:Cytokinin riboside 5'-monophosphate phosphoribohydrolase n=1 Tax=Nannochloropsis salina CCMP1776 TaxID=1027361 RepID=A0A4D9CYK1_9STRA|nr:hypothetical protein NSK_006840 [Nannochloropsis salina CCMP1776]|eukprot:TFJ81589.1 hypothetical protein NSK_006840 [Nannochloropsis salina CCMP1776]
MASPAPEKKYTMAVKAYKNPDFLNSGHARFIRVMCEYEETMYRLKAYGVKSTILFFGSARAKSREQYDHRMGELVEALAGAVTEQEQKDAEAAIATLRKTEWLTEYFDKVTELSKRLTDWSLQSEHKLAQARTYTGVTRYHLKTRGPVPHQSYSIIDEDVKEHPEQSIYITTGGGPGFMEAANKGASEVPGALTIGMGITLPFEDGLNPYVSEELAFEFHYFFTRKFWMVYHCQALVVAPGGMGTLDELFEVLTLKQTGKVQPDMPVVLFGKEFWKSIINWDALADYGVISQKDVSGLFFADTVDEAFDYLLSRLTKAPLNDIFKEFDGDKQPMDNTESVVA